MTTYIHIWVYLSKELFGTLRLHPWNVRSVPKTGLFWRLFLQKLNEGPLIETCSTYSRSGGDLCWAPSRGPGMRWLRTNCWTRLAWILHDPQVSWKKLEPRFWCGHRQSSGWCYRCIIRHMDEGHQSVPFSSLAWLVPSTHNPVGQSLALADTFKPSRFHSRAHAVTLLCCTRVTPCLISCFGPFCARADAVTLLCCVRAAPWLNSCCRFLHCVLLLYVASV